MHKQLFALSQIGVPGAAELFIVLIIFGLFGVLLGAWIYRDAASRGSAWAWQWAVGICFLFVLGFVPGLVGFLVYLAVRGPKAE